MGGDETEDPFISTDAVLDPAVDGKGSFSTNKVRHFSCLKASAAITIITNTSQRFSTVIRH